MEQLTLATQAVLREQAILALQQEKVMAVWAVRLQALQWAI